MTVFDRVKSLADKQGISIVELEEKLDFGKNSLYAWKKKVPNGANLEKVADFFNVSTDYLLGRKSPGVDDKINVDDIIENNRRLFYKHVELPEEDSDFINSFLRTYLESKEGQDRLRKNGYKGK
ncbi:MAG: helix-turn-helix domain-containing protein [Lactobacillus sp.]|jgi:transcriptional regulator with XRE-family HTH domain|nr:helix-turn-helix domain-containing protein [Lactobacillus sp.]